MKRTTIARKPASAKRITTLQSGESIPAGQPRRYRNGKGYVRLRWKVAPNAYVETYEHRVIDGVITQAEHVHHRNRRRDDNRPANLQPLSATAHAEEHGRAARLRGNRVTRLYQQGLSTAAIGKRLQLHPSRVVRILRQRGVTPRTTTDYARRFDAVELVARYEAGQGATRIARDLGISYERVQRALAEAGCRRRGSGRVPTGIAPATRKAVYERDGHCCSRCGAPTGSNRSIHHRKPRQMGGTRDPRIHALSNLVLLCGSGTTGCHGWIESHRAEALDQGWLVSAFEADPASVPVRYFDRSTWFHDDGTKTTEESA